MNVNFIQPNYDESSHIVSKVQSPLERLYFIMTFNTISLPYKVKSKMILKGKISWVNINKVNQYPPHSKTPMWMDDALMGVPFLFFLVLGTPRW